MKLKTINVQIIKPTLIVLAVFNHCNCDVANEMGQNREHMVRFPFLWNSNFHAGYCNYMFCSCFVLAEGKHVEAYLLCFVGSYLFFGLIRDIVVLYCSGFQRREFGDFPVCCSFWLGPSRY